MEATVEPVAIKLTRDPANVSSTGTNAVRVTSVAIKPAGLNFGGGHGTPVTTSTY